MADINKTYTSNTLYNDSTGVIAFAEQLKQELINWANYHHVTEELGPDNRPDTQNALNNLFLSVYERFLTFLNDADATEEAINTWKEIENFLADYTDEKTLAEIVAELNANIESRLTVPLESTTGSSTTSTMTQKAITETIDASKTFTTGEKVDNVGIDSEPIAGSDNLVKSGGVQKELALGAVYDVSAKNPTAGPNNDGKWESLAALLADANINTLIPSSVRKGGMSIKFIQGSVPSSDNKYVQARCMADEFTTDISAWQGVDDEPTAGSDNLVKSGSVYPIQQKANALWTNQGFADIVEKSLALSSGDTGLVSMGITLHTGHPYRLIINTDGHLISGSSFVQLTKTNDYTEKEEYNLNNIFPNFDKDSNNVYEFEPSDERNYFRFGNMGGSSNYNLSVKIVDLNTGKIYADAATEGQVAQNTSDIAAIKPSAEKTDMLWQNKIVEQKVNKSLPLSSGDSGLVSMGVTLNAGHTYKLYVDTDGHAISGTSFVQFTKTNDYTNKEEFKLEVIFPDFDKDSENEYNYTPSDSRSYFRFGNMGNSNNYNLKVRIVDPNVGEIYATHQEYEALKDEVEEINSKIPATEWALHKGDPTIKVGYHCIDGVETQTSASYACSDYIPVKLGDHFVLKYTLILALFDANKQYLGHISYQNFPLAYPTISSGSVETKSYYTADWIVDNPLSTESGFTVNAEDVAFIRINFTTAGDPQYGAAIISEGDYEVMCLGDSVTGKNIKPDDTPTVIQNITGMKTANCGFGGTTARTRPGNAGLYTPLSFWNIAKCIGDDDFTSLDEPWTDASQGYDKDDAYFFRNVGLISSIDYTKIKVITVAYGTNDWNLDAGAQVIDNVNDKFDVTTYKGALRYGIRAISQTYPNILICLFSPLYRWWPNDASETSRRGLDSDTVENEMNQKLTDYVTAMKEIAEEYKLPFFDNYHSMGINVFNRATYIPKGTHPTYPSGILRVGSKLAKEVNSII